MSKIKSRWTEFWDMCSGGSQKEKWHYIFMEAPEEEAEIIFYNRFGHNPERVTCTCCGADYAIDEYDSVERASAYHRDCKWINDERKFGGRYYVEEPSDKSYAKYQTIEQFEKRKDVLIIRAKDIKPEERKGTIPQQGYVWVD